MTSSPSTVQTSQADLFNSVPGGPGIIDWFGFVPTFHDATIRRLEIASDAVLIEIETFRMTSEIDADGFYVLDRHALVTVRLSAVSGIALRGSASGTTIAQMNLRRLEKKPSDWGQYEGPDAGDYEISFESVCGFDGSIFGRDVSFDLVPSSTELPRQD